MFFGVPYEMSRISSRQAHLGQIHLAQFMTEPFRIRTGTMHGYEVLIQVILVPVALTIGGTAIGVIIHAARNAH